MIEDEVREGDGGQTKKNSLSVPWEAIWHLFSLIYDATGRFGTKQECGLNYSRKIILSAQCIIKHMSKDGGGIIYTMMVVILLVRSVQI